MLSSYLEQARRRHPDWLVVRHEVLCAGPEPAFRRLCARRGLTFTDETARFLAASNRPGDGYSTQRLWHEQVDGGRRRLTPTEQALVRATLGRFTGAVPVGDRDRGPATERPDQLGVRTTSGMSRSVRRW